MTESINQQRRHPKGLYVLFATEFWERFSYYGMRAIFMLFMTKYLFFNKSVASEIYGTYTGLVYLTPLIGGYVADRYWGNRKSIFIGGILMAIGQLLLFFCASLPQDSGSSIILLWSGLGVLIFGNGFFKPNISTMVGQLYPDGDSRKDGAYSIFYMGINAGAFFAPLVCGYLGENVDFKWGFLCAGIGMLVGLLVFYFTKDKYIISPNGEQLGKQPNKSKEQDQSTNTSGGGIGLNQIIILIGGIAATVSVLYFFCNVDFWGSLIYGMTLVAPFVMITDKSLSKIEKDRLWVIILVMIFVVFFWMCFEQAGASLTFFADEQTNRTIFGWTMPASYFQSFNAGFIVLLAPILSFFWIKLANKGKNPAAPLKQAIGLFLLALGFLFIAFGAKNIPPSGASIFYLTGLYFIHTIGELCLSPIGLSMVNKLTPIRFTSLMMGVWFLAIATGNKLAGSLSSLYPESQKITMQFDAEKLKIDNNLINWDSVKNSSDFSQIKVLSANFVKKNEKSSEKDSISNNNLTSGTEKISISNNDTLKLKRVIKTVFDDYKPDIAKKFGDKEPKYILAKSVDSATFFLIKNEMLAKNNKVTMQVWNTQPATPVFMGFQIKDLYSYFMLFVALSGIAAFVLFILSTRLRKMMHGIN